MNRNNNDEGYKFIKFIRDELVIKYFNEILLKENGASHDQKHTNDWEELRKEEMDESSLDFNEIEDLFKRRLKKEEKESYILHIVSNLTGPAFKLFCIWSNYSKEAIIDESFCREFIRTHDPSNNDPIEEMPDYSRLEEKEFREVFLTILKKCLWKSNRIETSLDTDPPPILPYEQRQRYENPLDIEDDPYNACLLIDKFFDMPYIEQEAYKLRIKNDAIRNEISKLKKGLKVAMNEKECDDGERKRKKDEMVSEIGELEELLQNNKESELSEIFSPFGILSLQRKATLRVKIQWEQIKFRMNEEE
jgi:hypothetical protein